MNLSVAGIDVEPHRGGHNDVHFTSEAAFIDGLRRFLQLGGEPEN